MNFVDAREETEAKVYQTAVEHGWWEGGDRNIGALYEMVWDFRARYGEYFATPSPLMSLYFAETEAAEALDAWIRANSSEFNRAREKDLSVDHELTQCLMMILSAKPKIFLLREPLEGTISLLIAKIAYAAACLEKDDDVWETLAADAIRYILWLVPDLPARMQEVLDEIYEKRVKPKEL